MTIPNGSRRDPQLRLPSESGGSEIQVILAVRDDNPIASPRDYRRSIASVD